MIPRLDLFLTALVLASSTGAGAQCLNQTQWPQGVTTPDPSGLVTTIEACNFLSEYSVVTGIIEGDEYRFTVGDSGYITVRHGTYDGPVLGEGYAAVTVLATSADDLFAHWNLDEACAVETLCHPTAVQRMPDCVPPTAVVTTDPDCENNQFTISIAVQDLGDATSAGLTWTVNGGAPNSLAGLPVGDYQIGPFATFTQVDLTIEHAEQPACDVNFTGITASACVIHGCGPETYTLCYANSSTYQVGYQGDSGFPLRMQFNSGGIYQFGADVFTVYDGLDTQAPVLYTGTGTEGDLTGLVFTSTNPDHALTFTLVSDAFTSCGDGFSEEWNYTVGCLDCEPPVGLAEEVITDCEAQIFTVEVEVLDMGTSALLEIANDAGLPSTGISGPGVFTAGPFPVGSPVQLTLVSTESTICSVALGAFENSFCPIQIACGEPAFEDAYCYVDNDSQTWLYENTGPEALAILFSAGSIESSTWDHLTFYDGEDNTAPVLFDHNGFTTLDLSGLLIISTGPSIFMEMTSDGIVSCSDGTTQIQEWAWTVGCLDCEQPQAEYAVVLDCENSAFYVRTTIGSMGSDTTITITNNGGAPDVEVTGPGAYDSGPFTLGALVSVDVESDENALCNIGSEALTSAPCPLIGCGPFQFEFCYGDQMDTTIVYQGEGVNPIALLFNAGTLDAFGDYIEVYDGPDYQSPLMYTGNNSGDLTGLLFTSTNPQNALCVRFVSDFFDSCEDNGGTSPWNWSVSCLDCTNPVVDFEVVADCLHHGYNIIANVTDLGTATDLLITDSWSGDTLSGIGAGSTSIGPIPVSTSAHLTVLNSANPLCRSISDELIWTAEDCVITACEPMQSEHCYADADTAWFVYQTGENIPVTISFIAGQLLDGDELWIYNGLDQTAQLVFAGDLGGNVAGFALNSSNPDNALAILVISDGEGSCEGGQAFPPLLWTVGCGLVGEDTKAEDPPSVYPNPSQGLFNVELPIGWDGPLRAEVLDVTGRRVVDQWFKWGSRSAGLLDLRALAPGRYALRLAAAERSAVVRLEVVR